MRLYIFLHRNIMQLLEHMCTILGDFKDCMNARACVYWLAVRTSNLFSEKLSREISDWRNMLRAFKTMVYIKVWFRKLMESNTWVTMEKMGRLR